MPPANQQGSKAGLVTALVIFVILFVVATVFAIYFQVEWSNEAVLHKADVAKMNKIITPALVTDSSVTNLTAGDNKNTAVEELMNRQENLASLITGSAADSAKPDKEKAAELKLDPDKTYAEDKAEATLVKLGIPQSNLLQVVSDLSAKITVLTDQVAQAQKDAKAAQDQATQTKADADKQAKDDQGKIDDANKQLADAKAAADQRDKDRNADVAKIQQTAQDTLKTYQEANQKLQVEMASLNQKIASLTKDNQAMKVQVARFRIDPKDSIIQRAAGKVTQITDANTVFINIGHDQGVTPGLTFEVYDPAKGIPPLGDGQREGDLPIGLASLEVTHVLADSSECRVTRSTPGDAIVPGDVIMNLVFDPHTKYKFVVYGNFDLNQTGTVNAADAEVIKRLVQQWGGQVEPADQLNTDTDFLVLGTEPVVNDLSEDDKSDPQKVKQHDDAQTALDSYDAIREKAIQYGIPILNQNRFLYYTGYFDLARQ